MFYFARQDCVMNILIIDDSRFLRMANERALTRVGHNVVCASDGEEGLRLALERKPDLVVLDMPLPKVSGPDVRAPCARPRKPRRSR
jgi:DNA-binding response OmpR family regulator